MWSFFVIASLAILVSVDAQGLPYCLDCGDDCRPPRDTGVADLNWEPRTEPDPDSDNPDATRSCICHCGQRETEGCVLGECAFGLRCLHSKYTDTNGGNVCKPLCQDPSVYREVTYTRCIEDPDNDVAIVVPHTFACSDMYELPVSASRMLLDGHRSTFSFINPCQMSNANAELHSAGEDVWHIA